MKIIDEWVKVKQEINGWMPGDTVWQKKPEKSGELLNNDGKRMYLKESSLIYFPSKALFKVKQQISHTR